MSLRGRDVAEQDPDVKGVSTKAVPEINRDHGLQEVALPVLARICVDVPGVAKVVDLTVLIKDSGIVLGCAEVLCYQDIDALPEVLKFWHGPATIAHQNLQISTQIIQLPSHLALYVSGQTCRQLSMSRTIWRGVMQQIKRRQRHLGLLPTTSITTHSTAKSQP